jgi:hypothetical protein
MTVSHREERSTRCGQRHHVVRQLHRRQEPGWRGAARTWLARNGYTLCGRARYLDDSFASLALKRRLERGDITASEAPAGRVAVADNAMISAAVTAAAEWRSDTDLGSGRGLAVAGTRRNSGNADAIRPRRRGPRARNPVPGRAARRCAFRWRAAAAGVGAQSVG